jgi:methyl-accepting chemotaxis protein
MGYSLSEIQGEHHSIFLSPEDAAHPDYRAFWAKLGRGESDAKEYKRIAKGGREVWIQASYNPILNAKGAVVKIVKQATDITTSKLSNFEDRAKLAAIGRAQAVIEFTIAGDVVDANENFLNTLGYRLDEIKGRHHRIFVDPAYTQSAEYIEFWNRLNRGEYISAEFKRIGKGGKEVWIQASYNPIFDPSNKVVKIVKFATDVTDRVTAVNELAAALKELSHNNLGFRLDHGFMPSFEKLRLDFNASVEKLGATLADISISTGAIQSGTREISTASDDLSRRTEQQAASLEQTAAALDEITATLKKSAQGAAHVREVVTAANNDAERSGQVVRQAITAMSAIDSSSREIGQIIGVIDEIAFQTNLLALNAGVEAARAGDAGRGFAVVASEVRALAQRSADAAKEIKKLISASAQQVTDGVTLVGDTGKVLERIVAQIAEINSFMTEMAASTQEQSTALQEVNTAINQMDQVTQQNAAMVEETTAASHALSQETSKLSAMVGQFQVGDRGRGEERTEPGRAHAGHRSASKPMHELRVVGKGGAARKPQPAVDVEGWTEF